MYLILACIVLAFIWGWYEIDAAEGFACAIFGAIVGCFIAMLMGAALYSGGTDVERRVNLVNIQDNVHTEGEFFLGSGSIDGVPHYSFYMQTDNNTFVRRDIEASEAEIHYTNDAPHMIEHGQKDEPGWIKPWGFDMDAGTYWGQEYDFYIPRGSITSEYRLDAK